MRDEKAEKESREKKAGPHQGAAGQEVQPSAVQAERVEIDLEDGEEI